MSPTAVALADGHKLFFFARIKPAEMADVNNLWECDKQKKRQLRPRLRFCNSLAPTNDVKLNDTGKAAQRACFSGEPRDCLHRMR